MQALLNRQPTLFSDIKDFFKVHYNVNIHADFKSVGRQTGKVERFAKSVFNLVDTRRERESIYKSVTPNYARRDLFQ